MCQPIPTWEVYKHRDELLAALRVERCGLPVEAYRNGPRHVLVWLEGVDQLSQVRPDHLALGAHLDMSAICLAQADGHVRCRMFSPAYGVVEDAATGSAAGPIAIHLARHGLAEYAITLRILQGVEIGRPSLMLATVFGSGESVTSVRVGGHGVVVAAGRLRV
jgi:trans-2,3-dihydro-3-hydroxyanthranilate isomerase